MGIFGSIFNIGPDPQEVKDFGRGRRTSAKAAEAHAQAEHRRSEFAARKAAAAAAAKAARKGKQ